MYRISIISPTRNKRVSKGMETTLCDLYPQARVIMVEDLDCKGKGWAVRQGLKQAEHSIVVFIDGDFDIHPKMIKRLLPFLEDYDVVVGTKNIYALPFRRKIITFLSRLYIRFMFGLTIDTQTGVKAFRMDLPAWNTDGYAFDIELLAKLKKSGATMVEVPIEAIIKNSMPLKAIWKTLIDSIKIRLSL